MVCPGVEGFHSVSGGKRFSQWCVRGEKVFTVVCPGVDGFHSGVSTGVCTSLVEGLVMCPGRKGGGNIHSGVFGGGRMVFTVVTVSRGRGGGGFRGVCISDCSYKGKCKVFSSGKPEGRWFAQWCDGGYSQWCVWGWYGIHSGDIAGKGGRLNFTVVTWQDESVHHQAMRV